MPSRPEPSNSDVPPKPAARVPPPPPPPSDPPAGSLTPQPTPFEEILIEGLLEFVITGRDLHHWLWRGIVLGIAALTMGLTI